MHEHDSRELGADTYSMHVAVATELTRTTWTSEEGEWMSEVRAKRELGKKLLPLMVKAKTVVTRSHDE